jgi:hypothetical protein
VNSELERMWKNLAVAFFKVLSQGFPGGTEDSRLASRY